MDIDGVVNYLPFSYEVDGEELLTQSEVTEVMYAGEDGRTDPEYDS